MGNLIDTLMEVAGFPRKRRIPSARARGNGDATRSLRPDVKRAAVPLKTTSPVAARSKDPAPRVVEAARSKGGGQKIARTSAPRRERPVGGFKMAIVVAVFVTGGTWLGSQVQGLAASSRDVAPRDLHEMRPKSSNFTF